MVLQVGGVNLFAAGCFIVATFLLGLAIGAEHPGKDPAPTYDYEQLLFCLIDHNVGTNPIAADKKALRFCIEYDQKVR